MANIEFGLIMGEWAPAPERRSGYMEDIDRLLTLARGHYASAWFIDHLTGDILEGWTTLTYLSARHPGFQWGHTVLSQSFRNPALLARMGATLQLLTDGRFVLGIGAGGDEADYRACGYPFPSGGTRVDQLDEALRIIKAIWTEEHPSFEGEHYRIDDAHCGFRPDPLPPIRIGAFGPRMLRLTARHADCWDVSSTPIDDYRALVAEFERACDEVGRDPASVRRTWSAGCVCAPTEAEVRALAAPRARKGADLAYEPDVDLVGTPAQIIEQMAPFIELGVDAVIIDCGGFPDLTTVETLIDEVIPRVSRYH
jgi:alkanesulfonate monooxygenase SsuD/methylene tetrahydromethanopterin reductase-like flavin-dependent oxidoreductase (luciferase family)